jgi:outer membrane protein TolC
MVFFCYVVTMRTCLAIVTLWFLATPALAADAPRELQTWEDADVLLRARSADLRIALDDVLRAEAQSRTALAAALPTINATGSGSLNLVTNQGVQFCTVDGRQQACPVDIPIKRFADGNVSLSHPLVNVRAWHVIGTTNRGVEAATLAAEDTRRIVTLSVANSVVAVFTTERVAELNRIGLQNAETRLALAKQRLALGSGVLLDVIRAEQDLATAKASLVTGDESVRQARESLGLALGVAAPVSVAKTFNLDAVEASARKMCKPVNSPQERADVLALRKREEVAERTRTEASLAFLPTLNVASQVFTTTRDTGQAPNTTWNVQGILSWNIWDGGARYGLMRDTEAQVDQARQRGDAQERRATIESVQAARSVSVSTESRKVAEEARNLAEQVDRLTRIAFAEGRGTSLELVAAATALRQAEVNLALREFELVRAKLTAMLALSRCNN